MNFERIEYSGRKPYFDRHASTAWTPGDVKLVPESIAKRLLKFLEFKRVLSVPAVEQAQPLPDANDSTSQDLQQAHAMQAAIEQAEQTENQVREAMLLTIESMDKSALEEYARKYEIELDKRNGVGKLRAEVATLVEQFGVR